MRRPSSRRIEARPTCASLGERTIDGAVVMGDQTLSYSLQELIETRAEVNEIATLDDRLADIICRVRDDWRACRVGP